jgi:hypothetical protein
MAPHYENPDFHFSKAVPEKVACEMFLDAHFRKGGDPSNLSHGDRFRVLLPVSLPFVWLRSRCISLLIAKS